MVRWLVIAGVAAIAFTIYALVDVAMTQAPRIRAFPKTVWIALIVVLPVIGPVLWLLIGKSKPSRAKPTSTRKAPDDDPSFLGTIDGESSDERIKRLEEELRALDEEDQPSDEKDDDQDPKPPAS
ncbi:PLD nuclease N-terminal domain-containing protein [Pontimonas sp.]|nr:PLD nuclease N-terminal domain-containing protein [Pontimonas sp.]